MLQIICVLIIHFLKEDSTEIVLTAGVEEESKQGILKQGILNKMLVAPSGDSKGFLFYWH